MFTKRHYDQIARQIRRAKNDIVDTSIPKEAAQLRGIHRVQGWLANMFAEDNVNFDIDKFNEACSP